MNESCLDCRYLVAHIRYIQIQLDLIDAEHGFFGQYLSLNALFSIFQLLEVASTQNTLVHIQYLYVLSDFLLLNLQFVFTHVILFLSGEQILPLYW